MQRSPPPFDYFDDVPTAMLEVDLSELVGVIRSLPGRRYADVMEAIHREEIQPGDLFRKNMLLRANSAARELFGARSPEELAIRFSEIIPKEAIPTLVAGVVSLLDGKRLYQSETVNRRLDGSLVPLRLSMQRDPERDLSMVLISASNISRDTELREQVRTLSLIPEMNPNPVLMMQCEAHITYANAGARQWMTERDSRDLQTIHGLLPEHFADRHCAACDRRTQRTDTYERDGHIRDLRITPVLGENQCVVYLYDATDTVTLQRERDLFAQAVQGSGNAIAITDTHGRLEYVNPAFEKLHGISAEDGLGRDLRFVNPGKAAYWDAGVSEEQYDELFRSMWRSLEETGTWNGDVLNRVSGGGVRWMHLLIDRLSVGSECKYVSVATDIETMRRKQQDARLEVLGAITRLAELKDNETGRHMQRVGLYARSLAERLGQPFRFREEIEQFAPLHDIGKVGIADEILLAPRKLTKEEFAVIRRHTTLGYGILVDKPSLDMAAEIARDHHEWYDGTGYPQGSAGDAIPLAARIVAVSDVYDALRSSRPYKDPWDHDSAVAEIRSLAGRQFCPTVVDAFMTIAHEFREIAERYRE
ncbi:MAG: HD domain-containing phosphohydrolase [Alkalispirochaeta sp.]